MKILTHLLLCLSVATSSAYARRVVKRFDLLRDATREMFKIPKFTANMAWGKSGVAIDELITYLHNHDPKIYRLYDSERGLRLQLGKSNQRGDARRCLQLTTRCSRCRWQKNG